MWARNRKIMTFRQRLEAIRYAGVQTGRHAWQGVLRWWRAAAAVGGFLGAVVASAAGWQALMTAEHFRLARLDVTTATLPAAEVAAICGIEPGATNVLFTSAGDVRERCEADPRVRRAVVIVELPDRIAIEVEEQVPVMYVATQFGLGMVNRYGELYATADVADLRELPLLVASGPGAGLELSNELLAHGLALARTVSSPESPWAGQGVLISYDADLGFRVSAAGRGLQARFGQAPFPRKLNRLVAALDAAADRMLVVNEAFLDNEVRPNEVTLRLAPSGALAGL